MEKLVGIIFFLFVYYMVTGLLAMFFYDQEYPWGVSFKVELNRIIEQNKFRARLTMAWFCGLYVYKKLSNGEIAHLRIPRTARRTATPLGNKCRAERAFVLKIVDQNGNEVSEGRSIHDSNFVYKVGETVSVPDYNPDIRVECTSGIHFFMTEEEAKKY